MSDNDQLFSFYQYPRTIPSGSSRAIRSVASRPSSSCGSSAIFEDTVDPVIDRIVDQTLPKSILQRLDYSYIDRLKQRVRSRVWNKNTAAATAATAAAASPRPSSSSASDKEEDSDCSSNCSSVYTPRIIKDLQQLETATTPTAAEAVTNATEQQDIEDELLPWLLKQVYKYLYEYGIAVNSASNQKRKRNVKPLPADAGLYIAKALYNMLLSCEKEEQEEKK